MEKSNKELAVELTKSYIEATIKAVYATDYLPPMKQQATSPENFDSVFHYFYDMLSKTPNDK